MESFKKTSKWTIKSFFRLDPSVAFESASRLVKQMHKYHLAHLVGYCFLKNLIITPYAKSAKTS